MNSSPIVHTPGSYYCRPEWRWLRANYLKQTKRRPDKRIDDEHVIQARQALSRRRTKRSGSTPIDAAYDLWTGDELIRGELEAWLLTDEPEVDIATRLKIPLPVVEAFIAVFFDVRTKKAATDWLRKFAVGFCPFRGFTGPMPVSAWKLAAVDGGSYWLNQTIVATLSPPLPAVLPIDPSLISFTSLKSQMMVDLWIKLRDATSHTKFVKFIREYRQYRKWLGRVTGVKPKVSPSQLACEDFLLRIGKYESIFKEDFSELEMDCHIESLDRMPAFEELDPRTRHSRLITDNYT